MSREGFLCKEADCGLEGRTRADAQTSARHFLANFQDDSFHPGAGCRGRFKNHVFYPQLIPAESLLPMDHGALMQYLISRETRDWKADLTCRRTYLPPNSQRGGGATRALCATDRVG